jgi:hypothetical protein
MNGLASPVITQLNNFGRVKMKAHNPLFKISVGHLSDEAGTIMWLVPDKTAFWNG